MSPLYHEAQQRIATKAICQQLQHLSPLDQLVSQLRYHISTTLLVRLPKRKEAR